VLTLIKGGHVYSPQNLGQKDVLLGGTKILAIADGIDAPAGIETKIVDATGMNVIPGYVDGHVHILGAGGGHGPQSRSREVDITDLTKAGITTVVGTLGINCVSFHNRHLLAALNSLEIYGLTAYMYTGSYSLPSVTLMDTVLNDLANIEKVIGVALALYDTVSAYPTLETMKQLAHQAWLGSRLGFKAGVLHAHLGEADGNIAEICEMLVKMGLPPSIMMPTHVNRSEKVLGMSIEGGLAGASLDITGLNTPDFGLEEAVSPAAAFKRMLAAGIPLKRITMSSDGNGVQPFKNERGEVDRFVSTPIDAIAQEIKKAVWRDNIALEDILPISTINPAKTLRISDKKGSVEAGKDADVVLLDQNLDVDTVFAKGKLMLESKKPTVVCIIEKPE